MKKYYYCSNLEKAIQEKESDAVNNYRSHSWDEQSASQEEIDKGSGLCPKCDLMEFGQVLKILEVPGHNGEYEMEIIKIIKENKTINPSSSIKLNDDEFRALVKLGDELFYILTVVKADLYFKDQNYDKAQDEYLFSQEKCSLALFNYQKAQKIKEEEFLKEKITKCKNILDSIKEKLEFIDKVLDNSITEEVGLSVLLMDCSGSMKEPIDKNKSNLTRMEVTATAVTNAIWGMKSHYAGQQQAVFMMIFLFAEQVKPLFNMSVKEIFDQYHSIDDLKKHILTAMEDEETMGVLTDINSALEVSRVYVEEFMNFKNHKLKKTFNGKKYPIKNQSIEVPKGSNKYEFAPNVRVFLYSDGFQFVNGAKGKVVNPYKTKKVTGLSFDPLMMAYIGSNTKEEQEGIRNLRNETSKCPIHRVSQFFHVDFSTGNPENALMLQEIFHMSTGHSGLCPECMDDSQGSRNSKNIQKVLSSKKVIGSIKKDYGV